MSGPTPGSPAPRPRLAFRELLPRRVSPMPDLILERDLRPCRRGRLRAKLLVFRNRRALARAWVELLGPGHRLGRGCLGAVYGLATLYETSRRLEVDPRYFAVVGLVRGWLTMEIVCHEAVHLGLCYAKRVERDVFRASGSFDEERVAYPAGRMAAAVNRVLHAEGLYG